MKPLVPPMMLGVLMAVLVPALARAADDGDRKFFDAAFDATVARYHLPGLALGVVEDGKVVYARAEGERLAGSGQRIDAQTLFKIASNSKAMTSALLARLVDQGKLKWDDPVTKYLPDFRMHDPWVTQNMQVRDLLVHNSGLPAGAGDLMLWPDPNLFTRADVIHGLRYLKPAYSFRSRYAYDNTLYIVAGEVAAKAGGASYETLLKREVFGPLGLQRCQIGAWNRDAVGNVAQPHARSDGRNVPVRQDEAEIPDVPMAAAGGVRCSLDDMLKWTSMWLDPQHQGLVDGKPWLSDAQRRAVWAPQTIMPVSSLMREWDNSHMFAYGYGWRMTDVDGVWKVSHTGTLAGMYSALTLLPDRHVGFVIMINGDADDARTVLNQSLVKHYTAPQLGKTVTEYADALDALAAKAAASAKPAKVEPQHRLATRGDRAIIPGRYRDPWLGDATICPDGNSLRFTALKSPKMSGLLHMAGARAMVHWDDPTLDVDAWLDFATVKGATTLKMSKLDPHGDFSSDYEDLAFTRVSACPAQPPVRAMQER
ncbi:serine hydrolase [Solilutibacter silvestris]|uniref:serine hydrolase n=1 Tax=Solilutibacter silvestris TaxID=1645665 RepID=UPI003D32587D